ncbi:hypothetical protein, partial [Burkholderia gladioli]|uniref:hypothetical protein n=1 Tax=Burkholderia gladioli TaxID=28095 RepID=UPI001ABA82A9
SASRRIVTICSSVNRLFFMTSFLRWKPFSQVSTGPKITGQVTPCEAFSTLAWFLSYLPGTANHLSGV